MKSMLSAHCMMCCGSERRGMIFCAVFFTCRCSLLFSPEQNRACLSVAESNDQLRVAPCYCSLNREDKGETHRLSPLARIGVCTSMGSQFLESLTRKVSSERPSLASAGCDNNPIAPMSLVNSRALFLKRCRKRTGSLRPRNGKAVDSTGVAAFGASPALPF